jgi:hypothetical protein
MNRTVTFALLVSALAVTSCATDGVVLRHPTTGATVRCRQSPTLLEGSAMAYQRERDCVADYQRQGYERVPQ